MADIVLKSRVSMSFEFSITLTEEEARALDALAGYGVDPFIKHFYEHLGKAYLEKHEGGLRSFLAEIQKTIPAQIASVDETRKILKAAQRRVQADATPPTSPNPESQSA